MRPLPISLLVVLLLSFGGCTESETAPDAPAIADGSAAGCREGASCDDGLACTKNDTCDASGTCVGEPDNDVCMDELFCNGFEECRPDGEGADERGCVPGLMLMAEDDGIPCTTSVCDEEARTVENVPGDECECLTPGELCGDGDSGSCSASVCTPMLTCEERSCEMLFDELPCVDATCDAAGACVREDLPAGAACDDGVECTTGDTCETAGGTCAGTLDDTRCDDGTFCNGAETCTVEGCAAGEEPQPASPDERACVVVTCDEDTETVSSDDSLCGMCEDTSLYSDMDGDGFGETATEQIQCLPVGEPTPAGLATAADDCADDDTWRHPGAPEICFDFVDDDCDGSDTDDCDMETQPGLSVPNWDCSGSPPASVYAHAPLGDGRCFVFFQSPSGSMYGAPIGTDSMTCGNWDVRLYSFMLAGATEDCPPILTDAAFPNEIALFTAEQLEDFETQPVSNECRKYAHQLRDSGPFSYIAGDRAELDERIDQFGDVEVACLGYKGNYSVYSWRSLATGSISKNASFAP